MNNSKEHLTTLQDLREGESFADAAHRLGRDPVELFGAVLDAELKPAFERAAKIRAAEAKPPRKPRVTTLVKRTEAATGRPAYGVTYHPDGSLTVEVGEKAKTESDPLSTANGHDEREIVL